MNKKYYVHLLGSESDKNWDGVGTHPMFRKGQCGKIGHLTDCMSNLTCPECQQHLRENGENNEWIEKEWSKQQNKKYSKNYE